MEDDTCIPCIMIGGIAMMIIASTIFMGYSAAMLQEFLLKDDDESD